MGTTTRRWRRRRRLGCERSGWMGWREIWWWCESGLRSFFSKENSPALLHSDTHTKLASLLRPTRDGRRGGPTRTRCWRHGRGGRGARRSSFRVSVVGVVGGPAPARATRHRAQGEWRGKEADFLTQGGCEGQSASSCAEAASRLCQTRGHGLGLPCLETYTRERACALSLEGDECPPLSQAPRYTHPYHAGRQPRRPSPGRQRAER